MPYNRTRHVKSKLCNFSLIIHDITLNFFSRFFLNRMMWQVDTLSVLHSSFIKIAFKCRKKGAKRTKRRKKIVSLSYRWFPLVNICVPFREAWNSIDWRSFLNVFLSCVEGIWSIIDSSERKEEKKNSHKIVCWLEALKRR